MVHILGRVHFDIENLDDPYLFFERGIAGIFQMQSR